MKKDERLSLKEKLCVIDNNKSTCDESIKKSEETSKLFFENLESLIRPKRLAKALDISIKTIYDWKSRSHRYHAPEDLFLKFNRTLFIRKSVLLNWLNSKQF